MKRETIYDEREACPLYTAIGVISGRWKPMIMQRLAEGPRNAIVKRLYGRVYLL